MINRLRAQLQLRTRLKKLNLRRIALFKMLRYDPALFPEYGWAYLRSFNGDHLSLEDELPLITLKATAFLDDLLSQSSPIVFEYGAGGTTAFVSKRAARHIYVENIPDYCAYVEKFLRERGRTNLEPHCVESVKIIAAPPPPHPDYPWVNYLSSRPAYTGLDFTDYAKTIDQFPDQTFDLVIVDGRARPTCAFHAIPKIKDGGYLLLDDSNRVPYQDAVSYLDSRYESHHLKGVRPYHTMLHQPGADSQTSFWRVRIFK